ncbi:hypothetical protein [Mycolicibacterium komossense]|uniref:DUF805 domain-containing protein n=1 Tax=Mycolicibacterium komossense TaxID=1779 RepID=A0ABT3CG68_9MYCO|nr:hypothetical protein [Mycolicibacterium komossense]MCV7228473.1 hypothetical protein [Mycolicibacterium komossense]
MQADEFTRTFRSIERRVLEDVYIGRILRLVVIAAVLVLATSAFLGGRFSVRSARDGLNGDWLSVVATTVFVMACGVSLCALARKRFRWSCLALYFDALALVTGLAAVWSQQTGPSGLSWWAPMGVLAATALGLAWSSVVAIPLDRSQPDMRVATDRRVSR